MTACSGVGTCHCPGVAQGPPQLQAGRSSLLQAGGLGYCAPKITPVLGRTRTEMRCQADTTKVC